jgi:hypothetical protein
MHKPGKNQFSIFKQTGKLLDSHRLPRMLSSVLVFLALAAAGTAQNATGPLVIDPGPPPLNSTSLPGEVVPGAPGNFERVHISQTGN